MYHPGEILKRIHHAIFISEKEKQRLRMEEVLKEIEENQRIHNFVLWKLIHKLVIESEKFYTHL